MKKEIEVKILNIDLKGFRATLRARGARRIQKPTLFTEIYWKSPLPNPAFSSFRIRHEGARSFLTVKLSKTQHAKFLLREEYEITIGDFEMARQIVSLLGFSVFCERQKIRESYTLKGSRIEIDQYPLMKPYAEIESSTIVSAQSIMRKLGYSFDDTVNMTATEVIKGAGRNPYKLMFDVRKSRR